MTLLVNTLWLAIGTLAVALPVGVFLAVLLTRTDVPGRKIAAILLGALLFVPLYVQAGAWQAGFGASGWFTQATGLPPLVDGWRAAIWIHGVAAIPWVVLIVGVGLRLVEPELEEQGLLDASPAKVLWLVTLPRSRGPLVAAALWVAVAAAGEITVTNLFQVHTFADELYTAISATGDVTLWSIEVWPGVVVTAAMVAAALVLAAALSPARTVMTLRRSLTFNLATWRWPAAILMGGLLLVLVGVPLANLIYKAGYDWISGWSFAKLVSQVAASPARFGREFGWSFLIGSLAATTCVVIAVPLAWFARRGGWRAVPALAVTVLGLAIPGPLIGLGLIELFNQRDSALLTWLYDRTIAAPCLAQTIRALPLAMLIIWHAMRTVPQAMLDAASLDGAGEPDAIDEACPAAALAGRGSGLACVARGGDG